MWAELTTWRQVFVQFDKDQSGFIDVSELRKIFNSIGKKKFVGVLCLAIFSYNMYKMFA